MKVYYYNDPIGNFGDDINKWIWDELKPGFFDNDSSIMVSGIGTIISSSMPPAAKWYVLSSGIGYGFPPKDFGGDSWEILSVRGPLTAKVLGLDDHHYITDGAALLSTLKRFESIPENSRNGVIFIPHHHALLTGKWEDVCRNANIEFVNPQWDADVVINKIRHAKLVLADAMHGAIIADAMRVPWVPLVTSPQINSFKWLDWTSTVNISYAPFVLGSSSLREKIRSLGLGCYGERHLLAEPSFDKALQDFYNKRRLKSNKIWPWYNRAAKKIAYNIPDKVVRQFDLSKVDSRYIDSVSEKMYQCSLEAGYLSEDVTFKLNVSRLMEKLNKLKK
ncbi:polysaccharide pyruvyl transferase family protein [Pluralibacter gergoviae]|uniref:polysaccharide pyruvyl transferase family protein n=1 Tax=Pluralibacter gergoviae TaxID=61647 RepID=UPI003EE0A606